jgi:hypothetical protein
MAHEDKISTKCDYALYSASRNLDRAIDSIEQAADACWPDIAAASLNTKTVMVAGLLAIRLFYWPA